MVHTLANHVPFVSSVFKYLDGQNWKIYTSPSVIGEETEAQRDGIFFAHMLSQWQSEN